jgi:hypothetical protein
MQKEINKNNRRWSRYDVITNPRSIVPTALCPKMISTVDELDRVLQERGRNWIIVIPEEILNIHLVKLCVHEPNPLIFRAMLLGIKFQCP